MAHFNKGDEVSYTGGKSGKTIVCIVDGGGSDVVQVHWKDHPDTLRMIETGKLTLIKAAPVPDAPVSVEKRRMLRYVCLECGTKYNGGMCPMCGSNERILNTEEDLDMTQFAEITPAEPYRPSDDV